jgi:hypothetical protein
MYQSELSEGQAKRLEKWQAEQMEKKPSKTALGERWVFCFPYWIGDNNERN